MHKQQVRAVELAAVLEDQPDDVGIVDIGRAGPAVLDHVHTALEEHLLQHLGQVGIVAGQQLVARRDQGDAGTAAREEVGELAAGRPGAEHDQVLRQIAELENITRGQHPASVRPNERRHERRRSSAHQQGVERHLKLLPLDGRHQRVRPGDTAAAGQHLDVHAVHPLTHAAALVQRDGPRPGQRAAEVDLRETTSEVDPVVLGPLDLEHRVGRRQQRLRGDRVGHRAVAAELVLLDQGDVGAEVGGGRSGRIAGRSAAKNHKSHARDRRLWR